jgi:hypothetical protein
MAWIAILYTMVWMGAAAAWRMLDEDKHGIVQSICIGMIWPVVWAAFITIRLGE